MLGKWNYWNVPKFPYGDETSYRKAMEFLDGPYIIEDWGCGTAWAKKFVSKGRYIGIDGSQSVYCDTVADLREYKSEADAILIRHILEHNWEWRKVLENAVASFKRKLCVVLFTPFSVQTKEIARNPSGIPDLSFKKEEITDYLKPFSVREEEIKSDTQYGMEHFFYIERTSP